MIPISYNVRSLLVRKTTTVATALGIALVVFVLASSQMLARGIERTMAATGRPHNALVMRKGADAEMSSSIEQRIVGLVKAGPGVKRDGSGRPLAVADVFLVLAMEKPGTGGQVANVQLRGVPGDATGVRDQLRIVRGRPARPGTDEVIIGKRLEGEYDGFEVGQSFVLNKGRRAEVVGVFAADGSSFESEIWADVDTVRSTFGRQGIVSSVTVALESAAKFDGYKQALESDKQLNLQVLRENAYFEKQSEGTANLVRYLGIGIVFFFSLGAMIGAMITMYGAVSNRQKEIGTMRALGFSRFTILTSFLVESAVLALLGGAVGAICSVGMGLVEFSMMNAATWSEITFSFDPSPELLLQATILGGVMGLIGGFLPAVAAARTSPLEAMRD